MLSSLIWNSVSFKSLAAGDLLRLQFSSPSLQSIKIGQNCRKHIFQNYFSCCKFHFFNFWLIIQHESKNPKLEINAAAIHEKVSSLKLTNWFHWKCLWVLTLQKAVRCWCTVLLIELWVTIASVWSISFKLLNILWGIFKKDVCCCCVHEDFLQRKCTVLLLHKFLMISYQLYLSFTYLQLL